MTPTTHLEVIGARGKVPLTAVIDTGFDGEVCIPVAVAVRIGLDLVAQRPIELADGTQKTELVFAGRVRFLGKQQEAEIFLTESEEALIGTGLLEGCLFAIDFGTGRVRLERKSKRRSKRPQA